MSLIVVQTQMKRELLNRKIGQNKLSIIQHKETKKKKKIQKQGYIEKAWHLFSCRFRNKSKGEKWGKNNIENVMAE